MRTITIALTLIASMNAMALDCYSDATCAKKAIGLVKKALNKKVCKPEAQTAFRAIEAKQYDGTATNSLDACIKAQKSITDIQDLRNALK